MSATHAPSVHLHRPRINLWLVTVVGLTAALVTLGTWVLVDRYAGGDSATEEATALLDEWYAASSANDGNAAAALLAPDAVMWSNGTTIGGAKAIENEIATTPGLHIDRTAPVTAEGDFATTFMSFTVPVAGLNEEPMAEVYQLKEGKIFRIWSFALGVTPPFENTAIP